MIVYLIPTGATLLSKKGRVQGWRQSPLDRAGWKSIKSMAHRLRGRGVVQVLTSDLFEQSARLVGRELHIPTVVDQNWRHFNIGRHAGKPYAAVNDIIERAVEQWKTNPDIPISGGDSLTSWLARTQKALSKMRTLAGDIALVQDLRGISALRALTSESFDGSSLAHNVLNPDTIYFLRFDSEAPKLEAAWRSPSEKAVTHAHQTVG